MHLLRYLRLIVFTIGLLGAGCGGGEQDKEGLQAWDSHAHLHHHGEITHSHAHHGKHEHPWMKKGDVSRHLPYRPASVTAGKAGDAP